MDTKTEVISQDTSNEVPRSRLEKAIARVRNGLLSHKQDLLAAGVTEDQLSSGIAIAETRIRQEYEQKERENPLSRLKSAIERAAQSPDEQKMAEEAAARLEDFRNQWVKKIEWFQNLPSMQGENTDLRALVAKLRWNNMAPTFVDVRTPAGHSLVDYPSVTFLRGTLSADGTRVMPSDEFMEKALKELGALDLDQDLDSLTELPRNREFNMTEPYFELSSVGEPRAKQLPTEIEGVDAGVYLGRREILVSFNVDTFDKVLNPEI